MDKIVKDIYFVIVVLFSGSSIAYFRSQEGFILLFLFGLVVFGYTLLNPSKNFLIALAVWLGYFIISTVIIRSFHPFFLLTYIFKIAIAWWFINYYKETIFKKFEDVIVVIAAISLFFYAWQIIHVDSLYYLLRNLNLAMMKFANDHYASIVVYSINTNDLHEILPRNCGFTWEPGPFSGFIILAIVINIIRNNLLLSDIIRLSILCVALLTTFSTTGYVGFLAIAAWFVWYRFNGFYLRLFIVPIAAAILILVFTKVPFLMNKIEEESEQGIEDMIMYSVQYGYSYAPGRFAAFQIGLTDFKRYPIAGVGGNVSLRFTEQLGANISTVNGFATIMTRYGSIGVVIFLYLIIVSGKWLSEFYKSPGFFIYPVILFIISFGFNVIESPVFVIMWMVPVFLKFTELDSVFTEDTFERKILIIPR